jgi:hypothetical protein
MLSQSVEASDGLSGIISAAIMYRITPGNPKEKQVSTAHKIRMSVGSRLKYSAIPPQTPEIFFSDDLYSLLVIVVSL